MRSSFHLAKSILEHADAYEWSLQGFGMLRTYLAPEVRLHIWDSRYKVEDVTALHTHPWHFHSEVIAGGVANRRSRVVPEKLDPDWVRHVQQEIICGPGGCMTPVVSDVWLCHSPVELYSPGERYSQLAHEIHESRPLDGTVTVIEREFLDDTERAFVYIEKGKEWVSAEPRPATPEEVADIIGNSLSAWFA